MASASTSGKFFLRDTARNSERARYLHLARSGSQSQRRIWFILPAQGTSHIIINSNKERTDRPFLFVDDVANEFSDRNSNRKRNFGIFKESDIQ